MKTTRRRANADSAELRRMYIDCRFGQMHLTTAYPPNGGFDECTPLVFLHSDGGTGADFNRCAALLGVDRSVYAPDLPGSGASDGGDGRVNIPGLAGAIADLIDQLRFKAVDLIGIGRGASVAFELAATRPQDVRRLVVAGQPATAASSKPLLQLDLDTPALLQSPPAPIVGEIRSFLYRV